MVFPKELPLQAARQVARFLTKQDTDKGRVALAVYELAGFALGKVFPDAVYLSDEAPVVTDEKVNELVASLASDELIGLSPELQLLLEAAIVKLVKWGISKLGL